MTLLKIFFLSLAFTLLFCDLQAQNKRGLWIWNTSSILGNANELNILVNQCKDDGISEVYLYSYGLLSGTNTSNMQELIARMSCNNIRVWAMDGYRAYFDDWNGPSQYYSFINAVIAYNNASDPLEKFGGIQGDNEPQDGQGEPLSSFHNGIKDSDLSTSGGGVWKATEALDREYLLRSFLEITEYAYTTCHDNGLLYGQAMASWLDSYYGEPLQCTYNGQYKPLVHHMMEFLDDYCIMSYNTDPVNVAARVEGELAYAETLPLSSRPKVWAGLETHCGVGVNISYCDTPPDNTKAAVYADMQEIKDLLTSYTSLTGINIHDWEGWKNLPNVSDNTDDTAIPECFVSGLKKNEVNQQNAYSVYPNPFNADLTVENLIAGSGEQEIILLDNYGMILFSSVSVSTQNAKNIFSFPDLPAGLYVLKIKNSGSVSNFKIMKIK